MAYKKQNFANGEVLTSAHLNHIEDGIVDLETQVGGSGGNVENGEDGFSPIATVTQSQAGAVISITDKNGTTTATITNGKDGKDGKDGEQGEDGNEVVTTSGDGSVYTATVKSVTALTAGATFIMIPHTNSTTTAPKINVNGLGEKTIRQPLTTNTSATAPGASNNWLVANKPVKLMYDGTYWKTVEIPRPSATGLYGTAPIANGGTGATTAEQACVNLGIATAINDALTTAKQNGEFTPVKGVDYWTEADKESMIQEVIDSIGADVFGTLDANNNILLTGDLEQGTYTLKFTRPNGETVDVGILENTEYTNKLRKAIASDGTLYNGGQGWKTGWRLNSSGAEVALDGIEVTGFIPCAYGDTVYLKSVGWDIDGGYNDTTYVWAYDSGFNPLSYAIAVDINNGTTPLPSTASVDSDGNLTKFVVDSAFFANVKSGSLSDVAYLRLNCRYIDSGSVITINEPIT